MFAAPLILPTDLPKKKVKRARKRKTGAAAKPAAKRARRARTR